MKRASERTEPCQQIYIPLWSYSNVFLILGDFNRPLFTFHYGPIQIEEELGENDFIAIYIPLWSYSNFAGRTDNELFTTIYIPLWSYSNNGIMKLNEWVIKFTFHYGPIQMQQSQSCICNFRIYIPLWSYSNRGDPS